MRLKRKIYLFKRNSKSKVLIFIILFLIFFIWLVLKFINNKVNPVLSDYAELESRKLASIVINDAISKNVTENIDVDELFIITKDSNNEIKTIDFNPITVNKLLTKVTKSIQVDLRNIEKGNVEFLDLQNELSSYNVDKLKEGIIYEIPSGVIFGNSFLANLGPLIPVKFSLMGDIVSYVNTTVTDYGINNAVLQINIVLQLKEKVILPFTTSEINIETSIPVAIKLIQGSVPNYYLNGINQNSASLTLPIE